MNYPILKKEDYRSMDMDMIHRICKRQDLNPLVFINQLGLNKKGEEVSSPEKIKFLEELSSGN